MMLEKYGDFHKKRPIKEKIFILDGNKCTNLEGFYDEIQRVLTDNFTGFGRNLDALDDVLQGGFGKFEEGEKIILKWKNFEISRKRMNRRDFNKVIDIIEDHKEQVTLVTDK